MASSNTLRGKTLRGKTLRGKTLILAAPSGGLEPAVLPISGASGPATQTLTPARYDNSQTFYAHTVTVGSVTLTASRYDNAQTFYTHVLTQAVPAQNLSQTSRYDNSQTYYSHTLSVGAVTLTPSRFDNSQTFYSHTLTPGAVTLSPSRYDNAQTFYAHSVTVGAVTLTADRFDNAQTFYTHEITNSGGVQSLTQDARFDNSQTFYTHTLSQGPATQYLVAIDHVETGWVEDGWVGWPYFNTQTFYPATATLGEARKIESLQGGYHKKKKQKPDYEWEKAWLEANTRPEQAFIELVNNKQTREEAIDIVSINHVERDLDVIPEIDWQKVYNDAEKLHALLLLWQGAIQQARQEEEAIALLLMS